MSESLPFTGERFTPECVREIWYEHWHRYALATRFAAGRRVLDAACGEGYGSALLAARAREVVGVDLSEEAIAHARGRYTAGNLRFERGDATALDALPDASFDLIVSFETLEHVAAQAALVAGFARLLAPGGVLLLSSPDKRTYSEVAGFANEFHVRELYRAELDALLAPHFPARVVLGQKLLFQSVAWPLERAPSRVVADTLRADGTLAPTLDYAPLYFLVFAAKREGDLPADAALVSLFGDAAESVYSHYNGEVRRNMAAGTHMAELEQRVVAAEQRARDAEARAAAAEAAARSGFIARLKRWFA